MLWFKKLLCKYGFHKWINPKDGYSKPFCGRYFCDAIKK